MDEQGVNATRLDTLGSCHLRVNVSIFETETLVLVQEIINSCHEIFQVVFFVATRPCDNIITILSKVGVNSFVPLEVFEIFFKRYYFTL